MTPLRLGLSILAGLATVAVIWWLLHSVGFRFDPFHTKERAVEKATVATEQAASATEAVRQTDHFTNTVTVIREKQDAAVEAVQSAPGANAPLDPVRRSVLCSQLASVRGSPVCTDDSPGPAVP